ncbi:hypothetical protein [Paenibacillus sp. 481]|uniref:hypothetical protein n=1 Tax=Paenibacillus sp. 481 TaxID=2835869 RepID=UPI001E35D51C|nr:hypothetical protein [Paenibacillus sp. 481]UHA75471.1 hypothetical protein KIK04_10990 [Paenibacillus sp. 481]
MNIKKITCMIFITIFLTAGCTGSEQITKSPVETPSVNIEVADVLALRNKAQQDAEEAELAKEEQVIEQMCNSTTLTSTDMDKIADRYSEEYAKHGMGQSARGQDEMYAHIGQCFLSDMRKMTTNHQALQKQATAIHEVISDIVQSLLVVDMAHNGPGTENIHVAAMSLGEYGFYIHQFVKIKLSKDNISDELGYNKHKTSITKVVDGLAKKKLSEDNSVLAEEDLVAAQKDLKEEAPKLAVSIKKLFKLLPEKDRAANYLLEKISTRLNNSWEP